MTLIDNHVSTELFFLGMKDGQRVTDVADNPFGAKSSHIADYTLSVADQIRSLSRSNSQPAKAPGFNAYAAFLKERSNK